MNETMLRFDNHKTFEKLHILFKKGSLTYRIVLIYLYDLLEMCLNCRSLPGWIWCNYFWTTLSEPTMCWQQLPWPFQVCLRRWYCSACPPIQAWIEDDFWIESFWLLVIWYFKRTLQVFIYRFPFTKYLYIFFKKLQVYLKPSIDNIDH